MLKKSLKLLGLIVCFFLLNFACKKLTGGFCPTLLLQPELMHSKWNPPCCQVNLPLATITDQSFSYLGKGKQAYAFLSEDGAYVLKLFKPLSPVWHLPLFHHNYQIRFSNVPLAQQIFCTLYEDACLRQKQLDFQSNYNAFHLLSEETGLVYLHFAQTDQFHKSVVLFDKIGIRHELDLDSSCFLLQKRADLFYPTLQKLVEKKENPSAKKLIESYVHLCISCIKQGIINPTKIESNIGCSDLKAILIDT